MPGLSIANTSVITDSGKNSNAEGWYQPSALVKKNGLIGELLLNCRRAPLQIPIAHGPIEVDSGFLNALEAVQIK